MSPKLPLINQRDRVIVSFRVILEFFSGMLDLLFALRVSVAHLINSVEFLSTVFVSLGAYNTENESNSQKEVAIVCYFWPVDS